MNIKEKIDILKTKIGEIKKAKSEKRLWKAVRRRMVPKFYKRLVNAKHYSNLAKKNKADVSFVVSHNSESYFGINLPLMKVSPSGKFIFPEGTKRVMIDVGTAPNWPNSVEWLNRHPDDSVVIGIEPNIDSWCVTKAMYFFAAQLEKEPHLLTDVPQRGYVKQEHINRIFFIPAAVGNFQGYSLFNSNQSVGTSSLLSSNVKDALHLEMRKNLVPVIPLKEVLERIPDSIPYVEHLKVDAQGYDHEIVKSAGKAIKRCAVVSVEICAQNEYAHSYIGKDMINYIVSQGFKEIPGTEEHDQGTAFLVNLECIAMLPSLDYALRN